MFPNLTRQDSANKSAANSISVCEMLRRIWAATKVAVGPNVNNRFFGQFSVGVNLAPRWPQLAAAFLEHIAVIVRLGSKKQMIGANTRRIVTTVANFLTVQNRAEMQLKRKSMGKHSLLAVSVIQNPITGNTPVTCPKPTFAGFADSRPEVFFRWVRRLTDAGAMLSFLSDRSQKGFTAGLAYQGHAWGKMNRHSNHPQTMIGVPRPRLLAIARGFRLSNYSNLGG